MFDKVMSMWFCIRNDAVDILSMINKQKKMCGGKGGIDNGDNKIPTSSIVMKINKCHKSRGCLSHHIAMRQNLLAIIGAYRSVFHFAVILLNLRRNDLKHGRYHTFSF